MPTPLIVSDSDASSNLASKTRLITRQEEPKTPTTSSPICQSKKIWLVGLMACGKSSIGTQIARVLDATTVDMDKLIVQQQRMSIAEIFTQIQEK